MKEHSYEAVTKNAYTHAHCVYLAGECLRSSNKTNNKQDSRK